MKWKLAIILAFAALCELPANGAAARDIHYTLHSVNFQAPPLPSGGAVADSTAIGSFDYDSATQTISNISIMTTQTPGTLDCFEIAPPSCASPINRNPLDYTGSNYISSVPGISAGGATASQLADVANRTHALLVFDSGSAGGGSVSAPGGRTTTPCNHFLEKGCVLTLIVPANLIGRPGVIKLVSDLPIPLQTAASSADPQRKRIFATEAFSGGGGDSFVRYVFVGGYLRGVVKNNP